LLAGIIDSDGYYNDNCYEIVQKNEKLLDDIVFICRSLGFAAFKKKISKTCTNAPGGPKKGTYYITKIYGKGLEEIPVKCSRKIAHKRNQIKDALNYRISLEKLPENDYYGFEIDGNRRFVLGDFTVTHNTVISIKIATEMRKKTLIIVHKEFLMNQWIERIRDFCGPETTIGRIQGEKMEVEGNDFVIGMLQTLYSRAYPEEVFRPFGLLIIDETHRICSEQFSRALFKFSPRYTLGISATIERKDGLNKILNMFVGNIIYHEERSGDEPVCVRAIEYDAADGDDDYTKVEYDYRGSVKYSTMICKLCDYAPRTEFILRVISDLLEENENQQIMVIAHNKSVLHALYEGIVERNIATVGYYVGGMKEKDLKKTEEKTIVIATYSMAAEALDIKTLSTLVMVTPKTDIIQTVGRILRMKHNQPIVVDIVDSHDVFKNQWRQRRQYYKKCNYSVRYIKSTAYKGMNIDWEKDRTWRWVHAPAAAAAAQPPQPDQDPDSGAEDGTGATPAAAPRKCMLNIAALSASVAAAAAEKK
jgi:superfamily II DNA or RNA helicase